MFSLHPPRVQSDLDMIVARQRELRNTSSHAYLIQYMKELDSDEKVGNDESCLFTSSSFHSSAKRVQAPNDTNSEMKAANLTVSGTELWCLAARCLLGLHS